MRLSYFILALSLFTFQIDHYTIDPTDINRSVEVEERTTMNEIDVMLHSSLNTDFKIHLQKNNKFGFYLLTFDKSHLELELIHPDVLS
jgi:hypothetical protein